MDQDERGVKKSSLMGITLGSSIIFFLLWWMIKFFSGDSFVDNIDEYVD